MPDIVYTIYRHMSNKCATILQLSCDIWGLNYAIVCGYDVYMVNRNTTSARISERILDDLERSTEGVVANTKDAASRRTDAAALLFMAAPSIVQLAAVQATTTYATQPERTLSMIRQMMAISSQMDAGATSGLAPDPKAAADEVRERRRKK